MKISNIKRPGWIASALSLVALVVCGVAVAQPPGPPRGPGGPDGPGGPPHHRGAMGMGMLLRLESVREELGINEEQAIALKEKGESLRQEMRDQFGERMRRGPQGERGPKGERGEGPSDEMREKMKNMQGKVEAGLQEVLSTSQFERLKEIHVQAMIKMAGPRALAHGNLAEELNITDEQRDEMREAGRAAMENLREKARENFEALRSEAHDQVFAVLTTEQQQKLAQLQGEPMELDLPNRGRRGPGGPEARGPGKKGKGGSGERRGQRRGPRDERPAPDA